MTSILDQPADLDHLEKPDLDHLADDPAEHGPEDEQERALAPAALALAAVSALLSSAGAAWMVGGIFRGLEARLVGLLGVLIGCGFVYLGTRLRSSVLQYLTLPAALLAGAVLMSSASGAGTSSLPALVKDAATTSQVLQPPIDFAPGWRLILVVILALLSSAACSLALSLSRPRLAVAVPAPLVVAPAFIQPSSSAVVTSSVSVGLVMMALATSYAADGVGDTFDASFELRRLARSVLAGGLLIATLIAASKVSFLFPEKDKHHVVPPRRPPVSPPQPDVPLYTVTGALNGPLEAGVIDVYSVKEGAWLLPPVDNLRLKRLKSDADIPGAPAPFGASTSFSVTVKQATGHLLPSVSSALHLDGDVKVDYDPRTQSLSLPSRPVYTGLHYTVTTNPVPDGKQLSAVKGDVPYALREFLTAPDAPPAVTDLLAKAPQAPYAKLQSLRAALYRKFTAAGQGKPTDVDADRVVQLLRGGTGNPYELTASEALLARWAGIPSRIGFGYYNGNPLDDGSVEFRPANAATYLEVYLAPYGWVPIIGVPPRAQQSLSNNQRNNDSSIAASPELGINVYLPVKQDNRLPLYEYARYYLVRALPIALGVGALVLLYPVVLKRVRRRRRAAWASQFGPAGAIAVAYCALRDQMIDLALPGRGLTPLELVEIIEEDEEHAELAWLVTRGLWGDLRHRLTEEDAAAARALSASVSARLSKAQPETARLLAAVSRASLRHPHSLEVPNAWWELRLPRLRVPRLRALRPSVATSLLAVLATLTLGGCSSGGHHAEPSVAFPTRLAPTAVAGLEVHEEKRATAAYVKAAKDDAVIVNEGKVLSFNKNGLVQAALQVAQLKPGYVSTDKEVRDAITRSVGSGNQVAKLRPEGSHDLYNVVDGSQRIYLWFPTAKSMALLVLRTQITEGAAEALARGLIDYSDGGDISEAALSAAFADSTGPTPSGTPTSSPSPSASPEPTP